MKLPKPKPSNAEIIEALRNVTELAQHSAALGALSPSVIAARVMIARLLQP